MAVEGAGDTELGFDAHDPSLHTSSLLVAVRSRWASGARNAFRSLRIALWITEIAGPRSVPASAMPEPVGLDTAAPERRSPSRVARAAATVGGIRYPEWRPARLGARDLDRHPGAPPLTCARLGATVQAWVAATRRSVDELMSR